MIVQELDIYPNMEHGLHRFYAVQGESGARELRFNLYDETGAEKAVTGSRILLYTIKPDRNVAVIECKAGSGRENQASCLLTYQAGTCPGTCSMFLQVLTESGELRYDNMELVVKPANIDGIASRSDFGPLTHILQSAGHIDQLLSNVRGVAELLQSILQNYTKELSPEYSGVIDTGTAEKVFYLSDIAADDSGNLLMLDRSTKGGQQTRLSADGGKTWTLSPLVPENSTPTDVFLACCGGPKFLCLGDKYLLWAQAVNGKIIPETPVNCPIPISKSIRRCRYLNGNYWIFRTKSKTEAYPPVYFTGSGAEYIEVVLPDSGTREATDITYDPETGAYYMVGGFPRDTANFGTTWIIRSTDLKKWTTIQAWMGDDAEDRTAVFRDGAVTMYIRNSAELKIARITPAGGVTTTNTGQRFLTMQTAGNILCDVTLSDVKLVSTKDGAALQWYPVQLGLEEGSADIVHAAAFGRRIAITKGPAYYIYRMDMLGEDVAADMLQARGDYEVLSAQVRDLLESASGAAEVAENAKETADQAAEKVNRLITVSQTPLEAGVDKLETGCLYVVW